MSQMQQQNKMFKKLLRDYDYEVQGTLLIQKGIKNFSSDRIFRTGVRDLFDACEMLIPIIREDAFSNRFHEICES